MFVKFIVFLIFLAVCILGCFGIWLQENRPRAYDIVGFFLLGLTVVGIIVFIILATTGVLFQ